MSRNYGLNISIRDYDPEKSEEIKDIAAEYEFGDLFESESKTEICGFTVVNLAGGTSEEEWIREIAEKLWTVVGKCTVVFDVQYLEQVPTEEFTFGEEEYEEWKEAQP